MYIQTRNFNFDIQKTLFHDQTSCLAEHYKEFSLRYYYTDIGNSGIQKRVIKVISRRISHTSKLIRQRALKSMLSRILG